MVIYVLNIEKLNDDEVFEQYFLKMPGERQEKIAHIKHREDKNRSLGAGILLARGLFANGITYRDGVIAEDENGKPYLVRDCGGEERELSRQVYFNLSHSGDYVVAVFADVPVGIDIEHEREYRENVVRRCFTEAEQKELAECGCEEERRDVFLRYWTIKESAAKVSGLGMRLPFAAISLRDDCRIEVKWEDKLWKYFLREIEIPAKGDILGVKDKEKYRIAVCADMKEDEIPVWEEVRYEEI